MTQSILHVNFSESGGAGSVAKILQEEQSRQGLSAHFHHVITSHLRAEPLATPLHTVAAAIDHYAIKRGDFHAPISLLRDAVKSGFFSVEEADIVHLHGINGALALGDLATLSEGRKTIWTLHDMNPFTGGCHYSLGCDGFTSGCGNCPAVRSGFHRAIQRHLDAKREAIVEMDNLTVVTPSTWLAEHAAASEVFGNTPIVVQPNPINGSFIAPDNADSGKDDASALSVIAVAASLDDPVKNISFLVEAFTQAFGHRPDVKLTLVGRGGRSFARSNIRLFGIARQIELRDLLMHADVLVVPSLAENAPLVIPEAASQGCEAFVSKVGGMPEMVSQLGAGVVFADQESLVKALLQKNQQSHKARELIRKKLVTQTRAIYSPQAVARGYAKVYS